MKTTLDIPDEMYRAIKSRSAVEGMSVRRVTMMLYGDWLSTPDWKPHSEETAPLSVREDPVKPLPCFGIAGKFARKDVSHDMNAIRESIFAGRKAEFEKKRKGGLV